MNVFITREGIIQLLNKSNKYAKHRSTKKTKKRNIYNLFNTVVNPLFYYFTLLFLRYIIIFIH